MDKPAPTTHVVHELIRARWSPRAFSDRAVPGEALRALLEAARWAPSCFNEQPWRFVVAPRSAGADFERLLSLLNEKNAAWAKAAPVLMLSVAKKSFERSGKPNRHALHDVGLAAAQLTLQATALGLRVHQMAGFSQERARERLGIPDDFEPVAAIAVGYPADADALPEDVLERERAPRSRHPQRELVFGGSWGETLDLDDADR